MTNICRERCVIITFDSTICCIEQEILCEPKYENKQLLKNRYVI